MLEFNEKHQNQNGHGLKILTPQQIFSRLPVSLVYFLYRSKKLSKTIYTYLMNTI